MWIVALFAILLCADARAQALLTTLRPSDAGSHNTGFGMVVQTLPDVDGDLWPDLLVGSPGDPAAPGDSSEAGGAVHVFSGRSTEHLYTARPERVLGTPDFRAFGYAIVSMGDVNGNGTPDFAASGMLRAAPGDAEGGAVWVFDGKDGRQLYALSSPFPTLYTGFGLSLATVTDLDGDGTRDLVVAAPYEVTGTPTVRGRVRIYSGREGTLRRIHDGPAAESCLFGIAVADLRDLDGDGVTDYGVTLTTSAQSTLFPPDPLIHIYSGRSGQVLYEADPSLFGRNDHDPFGQGFGRPLVSVGDHDADGVPDFAVVAGGGANGGGYFRGCIYLFRGRDGTPLRIINPPGDNDAAFGHTIVPVGDLGDDGVPELLVGTPLDAVTVPQVEAGRAYLVPSQQGEPVQTIRSPSPTHFGRFGWSATLLPPLVGRRGPVLVIGTTSEAAPDRGGRVHLFELPGAVLTEGAEGPALESFSLSVPAPNPARGIVRFHYSASRERPAMVELVDRMGRTVVRFPEVARGAALVGQFDAHELASGAYLLRLRDGQQTITRSVTVVR